MISGSSIVLINVLDLYFYVVIAAVIASWLVGFGIVNLAITRWLEHPAGASRYRTGLRGVSPHHPGDWRLDLSPLIVLLLLGFFL